MGDLLKCCDLPTTDRLTLSIYVGIAHREKELISIRTKAAFQRKKAEGFKFGNTNNLTAKGRKLGLQRIRKNAADSTKNQKAMKIIARCKKINLSYGAIARELNQNGFTTVRNKQFHRATVKRLYERYLKADSSKVT